MEKAAEIHWHPHRTTAKAKHHVRMMNGRFQNLRRLASWPLIALFFGLVWIEVDGQPWLLFSFEQHRIVLFGKSLSWRELPILMGLLIASANLLFFTTVAYGRIWCGFACPQSVWTWIFIRIENITEGSASVRARNDQRAINHEIFFRRATKHVLWVLFALLTAITFTGYFVPIREIISNIFSADLSLSMASWLLISAALTYINAGLIREKICLHACPYSRFQGSMFESETKSVSYDSIRGEPRNKNQVNTGGCIDCTVCVQVCPTGIDIRDGLQASCRDCGACIDACDSVMDKINQPRGLIRFASENQLAQIKAPKRVRPKLLAYFGISLMTLIAIAIGFSQSSPLAVAIERDRHTLYTKENDNTICNHYRVKVEDISDNKLTVQASLRAPKNFELKGPESINLKANNGDWLQYSVCSPTKPKSSRTNLSFQFASAERTINKQSTFIAPSN